MLDVAYNLSNGMRLVVGQIVVRFDSVDTALQRQLLTRLSSSVTVAKVSGRDPGAISEQMGRQSIRPLDDISYCRSRSTQACR